MPVPVPAPSQPPSAPLVAGGSRTLIPPAVLRVLLAFVAGAAASVVAVLSQTGNPEQAILNPRTLIAGAVAAGLLALARAALVALEQQGISSVGIAADPTEHRTTKRSR